MASLAHFPPARTASAPGGVPRTQLARRGALQSPSSPRLPRRTPPHPSRRHRSTTSIASYIEGDDADATSTSGSVDDAAASGDDIAEAPAALFAANPKFAAVFASALNRQGGAAAALASGPPAEEAPSRSGLEEVLHTALRNQRSLLLELEDTKKRVDAQLLREQKQFERLQFALKKSISDHAYTTNMDKLRAREKAEWAAERKRLMGEE